MLLAGVVGIATIFLAQINLYAFAIGRFLVSCLIHGSTRGAIFTSGQSSSTVPQEEFCSLSRFATSYIFILYYAVDRSYLEIFWQPLIGYRHGYH